MKRLLTIEQVEALREEYPDPVEALQEAARIGAAIQREDTKLLLAYVIDYMATTDAVWKTKGKRWKLAADKTPSEEDVLLLDFMDARIALVNHIIEGFPLKHQGEIRARLSFPAQRIEWKEEK